MNLNDDPEAGLARPLDNRTLWEQVRDRMREDILAGRLEPGTELSEVALARDFGTSRGPLREALGRLASEGLVTITPRRGAVVTQLSREEFIDAYQVREALETISHMSPWEAPRFRRLVADVAACVVTVSRANGEPRGG